MKVKDVMTGTPAYCNSETNLGAATELLWNHNCGILPVVDAQEKVIGVITDRDICIALGTRNKLPGEMTVGEVTSRRLVSCRPEDEIRAVLAVMGEQQVRRLPVVNLNGKLEGILSMDDVVLHAETRAPGKAPELSFDDIGITLKRLYRPQLPEPAPRAAAAA